MKSALTKTEDDDEKSINSAGCSAQQRSLVAIFALCKTFISPDVYDEASAMTTCQQSVLK